MRTKQLAVNSGSNYRVIDLDKDVNELMIKENPMWRQQTKNSWLIGGNKNTKYFHSSTTQRHRRNKITGIYNFVGVWITQQESIVDTFTEFY